MAANNLWWHFGRFAEVVKGLDPAAEHFVPSMLPHERLRVYRLEGRRTTLIWCRDTRSDWRSELERGETPETLTGLAIPVASAHVRIYDPWSGNWSEAAPKNGRVALPGFRRSLILRGGTR